MRPVTASAGTVVATRKEPTLDGLKLLVVRACDVQGNATGAALGDPSRRVTCVSGDGSALYTIQALWTQARENLDVTTVICANRSYAILAYEHLQVSLNDLVSHHYYDLGLTSSYDGANGTYWVNLHDQCWGCETLPPTECDCDCEYSACGALGSVSFGWLHAHGGFTFDEGFFLDPRRRLERDRRPGEPPARRGPNSPPHAGGRWCADTDGRFFPSVLL